MNPLLLTLEFFVRLFSHTLFCLHLDKQCILSSWISLFSTLSPEHRNSVPDGPAPTPWSDCCHTNRSTNIHTLSHMHSDTSRKSLIWGSFTLVTLQRFCQGNRSHYIDIDLNSMQSLKVRHRRFLFNAPSGLCAHLITALHHIRQLQY